MPLWVVYHPPGTFVDDDAKQAFAADVTTIYTSIGLPDFYVVIEFVQLAINNTWVGGEKRDKKPFVRLAVDQIARTIADDDGVRHATTARIEKVLKPHIADKGYDWEIHIDETDRRLWRINGFIPPPHQSEGEVLWAKENRPVPY